MRITQISVFQVNLPFDRGTYRLSGGRSWEAMDSTVVRIETDDGIIGWGESCPFGPNYLEAFARGARAGIEELAPGLLGRDPSQPGVIYAHMDNNLLGHPYIKHGIDMACWDILGKLAKQPLYTLFGGILSEFPPTSGWIPSEHGEWMNELIGQHRADGCQQLSTKASGDADADIEFIRKLGELMLPGESVKIDVNGGWRVDQAMRVMLATEGVDAYFEQPCATYEECRTVRHACSRPITLDECALDADTIIRGWRDGACDSINLKIGRVGGLTPALRMRDLCSQLGIPMHVQCAGGSGITQAAIVHLAHSVAPDRLLYIWDIGDLSSYRTVNNPLPRKDGRMHAHHLPGLGVEPIESILGEPVAVYN
ncbi:MAG: mandelate racemase/muconate lactonizing enzyme family protein [Gammaproteobacteria bacterium]|nr:MAG: mandelate racemase/muconate lactonizing enzyme family protein [Gammaproteobacteria bacterium]